MIRKGPNESSVAPLSLDMSVSDDCPGSASTTDDDDPRTAVPERFQIVRPVQILNPQPRLFHKQLEFSDGKVTKPEWREVPAYQSIAINIVVVIRHRHQLFAPVN